MDSDIQQDDGVCILSICACLLILGILAIFVWPVV
jgi:hypothetical protein